MDAHTFNRQLKRLASDKRALEALYAEYALPMKAHLLRRFGSLVSAEDVTQDVFVKLLSLRDPPRVEYPASWLYTLADNRAKDISSTRRRAARSKRSTRTCGAFSTCISGRGTL